MFLHEVRSTLIILLSVLAFSASVARAEIPLKDLVVPKKATIKIFDSVCFGDDGKKIQSRLTYKVQSIVPYQNGLLATFSRSDGDEPEYLYISDEEVFDQTVGYVLLKKTMQKGDEWIEVDKRSGTEIAKIKVIEIGNSVVINKKRYKNCVSLLITIQTQNRTELHIFAPGVGLIQFKSFDGLEGYLMNRVKCTESLKTLK